MPFPCHAGVIEGFAVSSSWRASLLWSLAFPPATEAILATAAQGLNSPVYSYAKVRILACKCLHSALHMLRSVQDRQRDSPLMKS
jgi:hypothetical protein